MSKRSRPAMLTTDAAYELKRMFDGIQLQYIEEAFLGIASEWNLSIPAADGDGDLYFHDEELLARFSSMEVMFQKQFLQQVRAFMTGGHSDVLLLKVEWGQPHRERIGPRKFWKQLIRI